MAVGTVVLIKQSRLLSRIRSSFSALRVVLAGVSREADRANNLAVRHYWHPTLYRYGSFQTKYAKAGAAPSQCILKSLGTGA